MKRTIDLDQVRVVQADNYKGNSCVYVEIMDERVLYAYTSDLFNDENLQYYVKYDNYGNPEVDTDSLADLVRINLAHHFRKVLREEMSDFLKVFTDQPEREIDYTKPRLEEIDEY